MECSISNTLLKYKARMNHTENLIGSDLKWRDIWIWICVCCIDPMVNSEIHDFFISLSISLCVWWILAKILLFSFDVLRLRNIYFAQFWFLCADFSFTSLDLDIGYVFFFLISYAVPIVVVAVVFFFLSSLKSFIFSFSFFISSFKFIQFGIFLLVCEFVDPLFASFLRSFRSVYRLFFLFFVIFFFFLNRWMCRKCVPDSGSSVDSLHLRKKNG